jgi:hypothetical protein
MSIEIYARLIKNSPQPAFTEGFTHDGIMEAQEIEVKNFDDDENQLIIKIKGSTGQNDNVSLVRLRLPRSAAEGLARAIQISNKTRMPFIKLGL